MERETDYGTVRATQCVDNPDLWVATLDSEPFARAFGGTPDEAIDSLIAALDTLEGADL